MNFFSNIRDKIREKTEEFLEKKDFLTMVEDEAKPIRRKAYLEERKKNAWAEGKALARKETQKNMQKNSPQKRTEQDFGLMLMKGLEDPYKFISPKKNQVSKLTKSRKKKK